VAHEEKKPPPLLAGGTIGIVAPAGRVDLLLLEKGVRHLEALGFKIALGSHLEKACRYFAGTDQERAEDFQRMLQRPEVDAVLCARGGVGAARIIPFLDMSQILSRPKIVVGSSDITSLLLYLNESFGWITFHGPMVATQFGQEPPAMLEKNCFQVLSGEALEMSFEGLVSLRSGRAEGLLTGGCLTLICTTIGTAYEIKTEGKILFIEDINEAPFRIDRMLSYLKSIGKFEGVRGVIFGQMPQCRAEMLPEVILDILGEFTFPILFGFPSGHGAATATLPIGAKLRMDTWRRSVKILESI